MAVNSKLQERALQWSPETDEYIVISYNSGDDDIDFSDSDTWA